MTTELRRRFTDDMTLYGLAPTTQNVYVNAVRQLARRYGRSPDQLSEQELRDYFTYLIKEKRLASSTLRTQVFGIKFFYAKTLQKPWPTLKILRARRREKLPVVLDPAEAKRLLAVTRSPVARMCATLMYSCGLRISEALNLKVTDIDSQRMVVIVRSGKGNKDRHIPLPRRTLDLLRDYWRQHRPKTWLFITPDGRPLADHSVRYFLKKARQDTGIRKRVSCHTLRHSYATNLMAKGVDVRRNQKTIYGVLMKAAAHSLMRLAADPRYVGGRLGILAVLHTCTRTLAYHPHVHLLVPAGGVTHDGCWASARKDYLVPVKALSLVFRGVFVEMARKALPEQEFSDAIWAKRWWIDCRPTVQGTERVLQYLARYIYRVAFSNSRLIRIDHGQVTFRYRKCRERRWRTMTLPAEEFIRRFLQHVLPRGTHKVRYYGIWHPSKRQLLRRVQLLTGASQLPTAKYDEVTSETDTPGDGSVEKPRRCPHCHQGILILRQTLPRQPRPPP